MLRMFRRLCGTPGNGAETGDEGEKQRNDKEQARSTPGAPVSSTSTANPSIGMQRPSFQPLDQSIRALMHPEYVAFHDKYVQYVEPEYLRPWTPSIRTRTVWPYPGSPVVTVGTVQDLRPCPNFDVRIFRPGVPSRTTGYPLVIWFHGGGFAGGNIDSDNDLCSLLCNEVSCVVVNVDYRLAPEHPYPAAIEDFVEILKWASSEIGSGELCIDRTKIAIGGASAGANIATVGALIAAELSLSVALQLLVVPVTDNSASLESSWSSHPHAPGLTPPRMTWYRDLYLGTNNDNQDWRISPLYAPAAFVAKLPKTWIAIAEQDMLSTEGLAYAQKLKAAGVPVEVKTYAGMPHSMMAMSGVLQTGQRCMEDLVEAARQGLT